MSNYVKATNFATKDTLPSGDSNKIVKGTEYDNEFNSIAGAISSKADLASPGFTGTPTAPTATAGSNTTQVATTSFVIGAITTATGSLGTMSTQNASSVAITGGTISGVSLVGSVVGAIEATSLVLEGTTADSFETTISSEPTADRTITLPNATTTLVGTDTTQTLTNKTLTSPSLTTPNINSAQVATVTGSAPIYMVRAWVNFNGTGAVAIRSSGNVSSITDNSSGDYTINFTTAMPDANYSFQGCANRIDSATGGVMVSRKFGNGSDYSSFITASSFNITINNTANTPVDSDYVGISVFR